MAKLQTLKPRLQSIGSRLTIVEPGSWRSDKQTSTQRGYGYKWQKARERYLREHPLCVYCERDGRVTAASIVDHRIPHRGDMTLFWDESNWQSLCATHHSSTKQREEAQAGSK
ncbi:HNH endonuclease signature motif containing protein [Noviherbaspirillum malthae]|uniref:HNH endonuclease signature motif containing protein n=1 Tax=Noviherbaspirillum malthae TaxID=1260987 RepID=UPI00188E0370|nr:HNH endonuclease signature motif containing protein [Noviherbaspirillum malthae]